MSIMLIASPPAGGSVGRVIATVHEITGVAEMVERLRAEGEWPADHLPVITDLEGCWLMYEPGCFVELKERVNFFDGSADSLDDHIEETLRSKATIHRFMYGGGAGSWHDLLQREAEELARGLGLKFGTRRGRGPRRG